MQPYIFPSAVMGKHLMVHGDGVKDVAFEVEDCIALYKVTTMVWLLVIRLEQPVRDDTLVYVHLEPGWNFLLKSEKSHGNKW